MKTSKFTQFLSEDSCVLKDVIDSPDSILKLIEMNKGESLKCVYKEYSMLVFILEGELSVTSICARNMYQVRNAEMLFLPQGRTFYFECESRSRLLFCNIPPKIELFHKNPLSIYAKYVKSIPEKFLEREICKLPVHPILMKEVQHTIHDLPFFEQSKYFQAYSRDGFIIYIKNLYTPIEIAYFIRTILGEDMNFLALVLNIYHANITTQEFIEQSGMSESTFNRKFKKSFDMSLGHWLISKKREEIVEDLALTDLSIHEIAEKHFLTPNHLAKFCHLHYGMSPSELRTRLKIKHQQLLLKKE